MVDLSATRSVRLLRRDHAVRAELANVERLTALLMAEVEAARDLGAERVEVVAVPELRGSRLVRLIDRVSRGIGAGEVRIPAERDAVAAAFTAVVDPDLAEDGEAVGVATVGETAIGLAVGRPGSEPEWVGTRPAGAATMTGKARFSDPPRPNQIEAAISGATAKVASLTPPAMSRLLVTSDFAPVIERLCGTPVAHEDARRGLDSILGQTSSDLSAWFGTEPARSRLLPGTLVAHAALADAFGLPVEPVEHDPVAGRWWRGQAQPAGGRASR